MTNNGESEVKFKTIFFFIEIFEEFGAKEMYPIFKEFGDIDKVIIPPKREKRDKQFGFVRFFNVADDRLMAIKLVNIIIGSRTIHANLPRFDREKIGDLDHEKVHQRHNQGFEGATVEINRNNRKGYKSNNARGEQGGNDRKIYAQIVSGNQTNKQVVD